MSDTQGYGLGRLHAEDERDKAFPMAAAFAAVPTPNSHYWPIGPVLNQLQTPRCVGYASRQLLASSPHRYKAADPSADTIYLQAQLRDEWQGENYDGTSARGAMKYLAERGIVSVYRWAQSVEEAVQYVLTTGPVLCGTVWKTGMFSPLNGVVKPTGTVAGGHEYLMIGANVKTRTLSFCNSWGKSFGINGRFRMTFADFESLFADQGDLVAATES
jgi:hypothetical protein